MSEKSIQLFKEATGASRNQAVNYLQVFNGNLDEAVMAFLDSGEAPELEQAPQQAKNVPQILPHAAQTTEKKAGFFNLGRKQPAAVNQQPVLQQAPPPPATTATTQQTQKPTKSNFEQFKPVKGAGEEQFNDGGVKEGGSGTAVFRPNAKFECQIDVYRNGFAINRKFFSFQNPQNQQLYNEFMKNKSMPASVFEAFPPEQRPNGKQIDAKLTQHQCDFDESKTQFGEQPQQHQYAFEKNEKSRTIGAGAAMLNTNATGTVNNNFSLTGTNDANAVQVRVKCDSTFTIRCNKTHTLEDVIKGIKANGGLQSVDARNLHKCVIKQQSGGELDLKLTVDKAGIAQKCVFVVIK